MKINVEWYSNRNEEIHLGMMDQQLYQNLQLERAGRQVVGAFEGHLPNPFSLLGDPSCSHASPRANTSDMLMLD